MHLQKLETEINTIFGSSFKKLVGLKLLDYFRRFVEKFNIHQTKANQWKVLLVENSLPVPLKKPKKPKHARVLSNKTPKVEDFDISLIYPGTQINTEDSCISSLNKHEECIDSTQEFENAERCFDVIQSWDEIEISDEEGEEKEKEKEYAEDFKSKKITKSSIFPTSTLPIEIPSSQDLKKTHLQKQCLLKNKRQKEEGAVHCDPISSTVNEVEKLIEIRNTSKNVHQGQNVLVQPEKNPMDDNWSQMSSADSIVQSMSNFLEKVHSFGRSSESFALVVGKTDVVPNIESLAQIPWLCVFDFDMFSRECGLMSVLEGHINAVHSCTLKDRPQFSFSYTYWCQMRGNSQVPDTCIKCDARSWLNQMKTKLEEHLETLAQYISNNTILKVILLWPEEDEDMKFITKFITQLEAFLLPDIFVIHPNLQEESTSLAQIDSVLRIQVPLKSVYSYLKTNLPIVKPKRPAKYLLPTFDRSNDPRIDEFTASHLRENLNVLYFNGVQECSYDFYDIKEEGENFLRGGTLCWFVYYECDEGGYFDVKRDQMNTIINDIKNWHIKRSSSAILEIYHSPGAGGTTLSQRILWELHKDIPCVQVRSNILSATSDIVQHIKLLFEKTHLPILVLLDGRNDSEVNYLFNQLKLQSVSVIVLHVQRIRKELRETKLFRGKYCIKGQVSEREAKQFCLRYLEFCDTEDKRYNLQAITDNVTKGELHQVYEFGLTTFAHEYKGIEAYVRGYLQLQPESELDSTQKVLGYLSLVYFYGQMSVPCELFSKILKKANGVIFDDLPFEVRQLVVKSTNHQHIGFIRICHQIVAKEILEQILARNVCAHQKPSSQNLSQDACRNLLDFGIEFINDMKKSCNRKVHWSRNIIVEILNKTFLHRDTHDIDEYNFQKRKPKFSRFFTDMEKSISKPDRIKIMEHIVSCCPNNPNWHAHLGRMFTLFYQGKETETAEKHFKTAISLCEKESNRASKERNQCFEESFSYSPIYHMYGMHFYNRLCTVTRDSEVFFDRDIEIILDYARNACSNFEIAREKSFPGVSQSYGIVGEIMSRLEVCNYINKNLGMSLSEYVKSPMSPMVAFVRESMVQTCELIAQCYSTVDRDELPSEMSHHVNLYKELFRGQEISELCSLDGPIDCTHRRHFITQIKLKYGKFDQYDILSLNNKTPTEEIREIVRHLENNFKDLEIKGSFEMKKGHIESDFKDWINAIRLSQYDKDIRLEDVLRRVRQWHDNVHTPLSTFYVFVLCASIAMVNNDTSRFIEAKDMLEEVKTYKSHFLKPYKPREWLGVHSGFKCLIPGLFLKSKLDSGFDEVEIEKTLDVAPLFLKGTISGSNKRPHCGTIAIDVCNGSQFDVFFIPVRTRERLVGSTNSNRRVEFILGFTVSHGFVAYNVKTLEMVQCENCPRSVEFVTNQLIAECKCGHRVPKPKAGDKFFPDSN